MCLKRVGEQRSKDICLKRFVSKDQRYVSAKGSLAENEMVSYMIICRLYCDWYVGLSTEFGWEFSYYSFFFVVYKTEIFTYTSLTLSRHYGFPMLYKMVHHYTLETRYKRLGSHHEQHCI